jgi:hypothetical protein
VARQPSKEPVDDAELDGVEDAELDDVEDDELDDVEDAELDDVEDDEIEDEADDEIEGDADEDVDAKERSADADALWEELRIQPVEIALPKGVGYTLRAYRLNTELTPTEVQPEDDAFEPADEEPEVIEISDSEVFSDEYAEVAERERPGSSQKQKAGSSDESDDESDDVSDDIDAELEESESGDADDEADADTEDDADEAGEEAEEAEEDEAAEEPEPEEVPAFLGHRGRLFLFRSPEALVAFVKSDAEHDLTQLDTWESAKSRISAANVVPTDDDRYELDLVVENLRGGRDAWDSDLLISAGEVARDLAYALRLEAVRTALSAGSPLDDLDEALRADANGGFGAFFARRRLKKIGAQQAALGWRTIIGKISAAVDWRD